MAEVKVGHLVSYLFLGIHRGEGANSLTISGIPCASLLLLCNSISLTLLHPKNLSAVCNALGTNAVHCKNE